MDDWKEQFSREELQAMGEEVEQEQAAPESQESEAGEAKPAEEAKAEPIPEQKPEEEAPKPEEEKKPEEAKPTEPEPEPEEGKPVPYDRFKKIYGQAKATERERELYKEKLDLFKRDPSEYYTRYPDERPADWQPPAAKGEPEPATPATPKATRIIPMREMLNAVVNDPKNTDFHGRSLRDLLAEGTPESVAAANDYYQTYVESVREEVRKAKDLEAQSINAIRTEAQTFLDDRAKELYQKPFAELSDEQQAAAESIGKQVLAWMQKNSLSHYRIDHAYKLMKHDDLIRAAREQGAKAIVDQAKTGNVRSVGATASTPPADPYARYSGMKAEELTKMLMEMPDEKYSEFLAKATPEFRKKFPDLPYQV